MATRLSFALQRSVSVFLNNVHRNCPLTLKPACCHHSYGLSNALCAPCFSSLSSKNRNDHSIHSHSTSFPSKGFIVPSRQYGRKVKPKPQRITFFEYSGDLRTLPKIDMGEILYPYQDHMEELERDEISKKLASLEFASEAERNQHMQNVVQDRIIELFGPDSELEQRIASFTLRIRQMIPYCIENKTDKLKKIWLLKAIFHRRRLLTALRELDYERFEWLLRELKIRYVIPQDHKEWKGWKHNLQEATKVDAMAEKRQKLEEFKTKLAAEKESFLRYKAEILAEINRDLDKYGLSRDFLDEVQKKEVERQRAHKILTWEERVKLGMTGKIKEYYG